MWNTFFQLLRRDFTVFSHNYIDNILNGLAWLVPNVVIYNFIFPDLGLADGYGVFVLVGGIATVGLFTAVSHIPVMLADMHDNQAIFYYLSLPLPQCMVFVRYALSFAMSSTLVSLATLPLSKLALWSTFDLSNFSLIKYLIIFPLIQLFFGFFALIITAYTKDVQQYEKAWVRIVFPFWFFGCYQFPWHSMHTQMPWFAYVNLLNPLTYALEGFRAAILGQGDYINYWYCVAMLCVFIVVVAWWGTYKFMQRLDCIR